VIHPVAAAGFAAGAVEYERGRPGYPTEAVKALGLAPGLVVVDLAAGTGKFTRPLTDSGASVIAVEPVAEMRAALPSSVRALDGTAERIPLEDGTADLVTVAQAFHWFDGPAALAEIHRVLRPGGRLALIWNRRMEADPINRAIDELLAPHRAATPTHRWDKWRAAFDRTTLFGPLEVQTFPNEQVLDADGLAARVGSTSFIASLPDAERSRVLSAARALAADGEVSVHHRTEVHLCERLGPGAA
jgi:SAM-dependent methyltransferase